MSPSRKNNSKGNVNHTNLTLQSALSVNKEASEQKARKSAETELLADFIKI